MDAIMIRNAGGPILAALLLAIAACGKKEETAPTRPNLAPPEKTFSSAGQTVPREKIAAQAEAKASSGPIELSLFLHKTQLKLGDSVWHQLRIRNVGTQEILVTDKLFHNPWQLRRNISSGYGIYIEVQGPDGKPLELAPPGDSHRGHLTQDSGMLRIAGPKEQALVDGWKKQGLSGLEVDHKLIDYNLKKERDLESEQRSPVITLKPGEYAETKSWFYYSDIERIRKRPIPEAIGDFTELHFFDLVRPGKYKVRAVYNKKISETGKKEYRDLGLSYYGLVLVRTPWVPVEVSP